MCSIRKKMAYKSRGQKLLPQLSGFKLKALMHNSPSLRSILANEPTQSLLVHFVWVEIDPEIVEARQKWKILPLTRCTKALIYINNGSERMSK